MMPRACAGDVARDAQRLLHRQLGLARQALAQRLAFDVGHGEPQVLAGVAGVVHGQDVRMLELGQHGDLLAKPIGTQRSSQAGMQHLDRHLPDVLGVARQVDRGHPATPDLAFQLVPRPKLLLHALRTTCRHPCELP
jgi:hypothetical protein